MTRSIRLVARSSSPVLRAGYETKRNAEKHECSLLLVSSDGSSILPASTIYLHPLNALETISFTAPHCWPAQPLCANQFDRREAISDSRDDEEGAARGTPTASAKRLAAATVISLQRGLRPCSAISNSSSQRFTAMNAKRSPNISRIAVRKAPNSASASKIREP